MGVGEEGESSQNETFVAGRGVCVVYNREVVEVTKKGCEERRIIN